MPVFNVAQKTEFDLSPLAPVSYMNVQTQSASLTENDEPLELNYSVGTHKYGEIVNSGDPTDRSILYILPISPGDADPSKQDIVTSGIPVYPGGSSYQIPVNSNLRYFVSSNGAFDFVGHFYAP
jgi:hypothetical protein